MNAIEVNGLVKKFKNIAAVDQISFSVKEGTIFGLLGPNGAGKTTTIECILGLKEKDEGEVKLLGLDPIKDAETIVQQIGVQLQETSYQDKIKVYELCELFTAMYDDPIDYEPLLVRFGLGDKTKSYVSQLSGGQKQKVAIILALIGNPRLIFLDELTTGLDPKSRREMWEIIKDLKEEGKTILLTTHYMEEAAYLCDTIGIINEGKIVVIDDVEGIVEHANLDIKISFETDQKIISQLNEVLDGINQIIDEENKVTIHTKKEDLLTDLIFYLKEQGINYKKMRVEQPSLEEAYLQLTGREGEMRI